MHNEARLIRVASSSRPALVAGAIAGMIRARETVIVQAIGSAAVNQAIKAVAVARSYLEGDGLDILCGPSFVEVVIEGQERTVIRLEIVERPLS